LESTYEEYNLKEVCIFFLCDSKASVMILSYGSDNIFVWTGGKTVYPPPPLGSGGMKIFCARVFVLNIQKDQSTRSKVIP
jgi:hypothetical protein